MPRGSHHDGRDPLSIDYDPWARRLLEQLAADPWQWHGRLVLSADSPELHGPHQLSDGERAAQRSLYWNVGHAASSGARIRPRWSLQVAWMPAAAAGPAMRRRVITARVMPKAAGRRFYLEQ